MLNTGAGIPIVSTRYNLDADPFNRGDANDTGVPAVEDYDSPIYDEFWETAIELGLPLSFHILTTKSDRTRGPAISSFLSIVRGCQDIMAMLVFGGVFERHPGLKVVCVEADAGWVPHFMYRMDHAFNRHRYWLKPGADLTRLPSEYFAEHIYVTFQDDWTAFRFADAMNSKRLIGVTLSSVPVSGSSVLR